MKAKTIGIMLIVGILLLAGCGKKEIKNEQNLPTKSFTYTSQEGKAFGSKDLTGKVWVSDFVFTSCADVCPPMTSNMAKLQQKVKDKGLKDVEFISFSVDPTVDSPEALKVYAKKFGAKLNNWNLLTGYSQEEIENKALKEFKTFVKKPQKGNQVIHGTEFFLVDQKGTIRKSYSGLQDVPYDEILNDIEALQQN